MTGSIRLAFKGPAMAAAVALASLGACDRPGAPASAPSDAPGEPASAFSHAIDGDISGFYLPAETTVVQMYRLRYLALGQAPEFEAWEQGERNTTHAPVMLEFEDISSPEVSNELGGTAHSVWVRVLPTTYQVTNDEVRFTGTTAELGAISFEGRLDAGALATARRNLGDEAPVLTGTLRVGSRTFPNQAFRWFGGD